MRQEEAELKLKKYHAKLFAKGKKGKSKSTIENEFDVFDIFRMFSKGNAGFQAVKAL